MNVKLGYVLVALTFLISLCQSMRQSTGRKASQYVRRPLRAVGASVGEKLDFEEDLYAVIEASPTSSQQELKRAYYKVVFKYHPDNKEGEEAKLLCNQQMMVINAAYKVLRDATSRAGYDRKRSLKSQTAPSSTKNYSSSTARSNTQSYRSYQPSASASTGPSAGGAGATSGKTSGEEYESGESLLDVIADIWSDITTNGAVNIIDDALSMLGDSSTSSGNRRRESSSVWDELKGMKEVLDVQSSLIVSRACS